MGAPESNRGLVRFKDVVLPAFATEGEARQGWVEGRRPERWRRCLHDEDGREGAFGRCTPARIRVDEEGDLDEDFARETTRIIPLN